MLHEVNMELSLSRGNKGKFLSSSWEELVYLELCWFSGRNSVSFSCLLCFSLELHFLSIGVMIYTEAILILNAGLGERA